VVARATRLVEHNAERFAKRILPRPDAIGQLILAPDPSDDVARARRLLTTWAPALRAPDASTHAVLARTNAELAPYAAAALELGLPYRAETDGLDLLDDPASDRLLAQAEAGAGPPPAALGHLQHTVTRAERPVLGALLGWSPAYASISALRAGIASAREARSRLRRDDAPLLLATVHSTKGLEFDVVACVGLDEGRFPSARSLADAEDPARALEEERRLAYVAWTRARRSLLLVFDPGAPSPFLHEAFDPSELARAWSARPRSARPP